VALFVSASLRSRPYEYLEQEKIDTLYGVDGMVRERRDRFQPVFSRQLVIGIVLCVVAAIPLFATMIIFDGNDFLAAVSICVMLAIIAIGVFMIVRVCIIWDGFHQLLEEGDYSRSSKDELKKYGWFHGCFWMLVTAAFLAWSFITNRWDRSWIIWPVAGVAYGAIYAILKAARQKSE
jgi:amino acid transporter